MFTVTIEDVIDGRMPEEYYHVPHYIYVVRDGSKVYYVGKAERQTTVERLLEHIAANHSSDLYSQSGSPSDLGLTLAANAPQSRTWAVDMLTLADCLVFAKPGTHRLTVAQAEAMLIRHYQPVLNKTNVLTPHPPALPDPRPQSTDSRNSAKGDRVVLPSYTPDFLADSSENKRTQQTYRSALLSFQQFAEHDGLAQPQKSLVPAQLHVKIAAGYVTWLRRQGYSSNSIRVYVAAVFQYLSWLQTHEKLTNPLRVEDMRLHLERRFGPHLRSLPKERRQADERVGLLLNFYADLLRKPLRDSPRGRRQRLSYLRNQALLQTLYSTAGRASEIVQLSRAEVEDGHAQQIEIIGKGGRKRWIFFTSAAQEAIQAYLQARDEAQKVATAETSCARKGEPLFVRHDRDDLMPITTKSLWQIVNEAAKAVFGTDSVGRPQMRVGPHDFRRLRAQNLYDDGMPIDLIQSLLGHTSVITTRTFYPERTSPETLARQLEAFGRDPAQVAQSAQRSQEEATPDLQKSVSPSQAARRARKKQAST